MIDPFEIAIACLFLFLAGVAGFFAGGCCERQDMEKEAVAAGVAKFEPNPQWKGHVQFRWLPPATGGEE